MTKYNIHNNCCSSSYCRLPTGLFIQFCGSLNLMVDNDKFNVTRNHLLYLVFVGIIIFFFFFLFSFHVPFFLSIHFFLCAFLLALFAILLYTRTIVRMQTARTTNVSYNAICNGCHKEIFAVLAIKYETKNNGYKC